MTKSDPGTILNMLFEEWSKSDMSNLPKDLTNRDVTMLIKGFTGGAIMATVAKDQQVHIQRFIEELKNRVQH